MDWIDNGYLEPFSRAYYDLCVDLMAEGDPAEPRGRKTIELCGVRFELDPRYPLPDRPKFHERFALLETLQVITGRGDLNQLRKYAPRFPSMAPSYVTYGPRLSWQFKEVVRKLSDDNLSRQALVQVYLPEDLQKQYPETPCTLSLQYLLRQERLHCVATMRSNDVWFGTPNDVYMFTFLQRELARALGVEVGAYVHQAGSLHIYEEHWPSLEDVSDTVLPVRPGRGLHDWEDGASALERWVETVRLAANFLDHDYGVEELDPGCSTWAAWLT